MPQLTQPQLTALYEQHIDHLNQLITLSAGIHGSGIDKPINDLDRLITDLDHYIHSHAFANAIGQTTEDYCEVFDAFIRASGEDSPITDILKERFDQIAVTLGISGTLNS